MGIDSLVTWSSQLCQREDDPDSRVLVATVDARRGRRGRTFLAAQGFRSWIEPFEMQRFQLIAAELRARIVVVETPGFGGAGTRLTGRERRALRVGDFRPLGQRMATAGISALDDGPDALSFLGYSMGASVAAAMAQAAAAQGCTVSELVVVDPVILGRTGLRPLIAATLRENRCEASYLATNDRIDGAVVQGRRHRISRPPSRRRIDQFLLGVALSRSRFADQLPAGSAGPGRLIAVRGDRSALCRAEFDVAVTELTVPGHHAFWHSLPAVADMAHRLGLILEDSSGREIRDAAVADVDAGLARP